VFMWDNLKSHFDDELANLISWNSSSPTLLAGTRSNRVHI
jgi:hypothetical protein